MKQRPPLLHTKFAMRSAPCPMPLAAKQVIELIKDVPLYVEWQNQIKEIMQFLHDVPYRPITHSCIQHETEITR